MLCKSFKGMAGNRGCRGKFANLLIDCGAIDFDALAPEFYHHIRFGAILPYFCNSLRNEGVYIGGVRHCDCFFFVGSRESHLTIRRIITRCIAMRIGLSYRVFATVQSGKLLAFSSFECECLAEVIRTGYGKPKFQWIVCRYSKGLRLNFIYEHFRYGQLR